MRLLLLAIAAINHAFAFVPNGKLKVVASASIKSPYLEVECIRSLSSKNKILTKHPPLHSSVVDEGVIKNTIFPIPEPITDEELLSKGLPILVEAAKHAKAGRIMCRELPENGCVNVSYRTVLRDSTKISNYITSVMKKEIDDTGNFEKPRTVAHLTEPGSEYLSCMFGVS